MIWSFYRSDTGVFIGQLFSGPRLDPANIPAGCAAYGGAVDHRRQRLDISTGELVDHVPEAENQWVVQSRLIATQMAEIEALERLQIRSMSELFDDPGNQEARENYNRRKSRIAELRQLVTAGKETIARVERPR